MLPRHIQGTGPLDHKSRVPLKTDSQSCNTETVQASAAANGPKSRVKKSSGKERARVGGEI